MIDREVVKKRTLHRPRHRNKRKQSALDARNKVKTN